MRSYISSEIEQLKTLEEKQDVFNKIVEVIDHTTHFNSVIYTIGNGGSHATASHIVNDFTKAGYNAQCLGDNNSSIMAIANDINYEEIFSYQLARKANPEDILIIYSGSGNSKNLIRAIEAAKVIGMKTVGITAFDGGYVAENVDYSLHFKINDMQIAEDLGLAVSHMLLRKLKEED